MAIDTGLLFKIKADGSQAKAEARDTARAVENAFDKDPFGDFRARMDDMKARLARLKAGANDAARGVDDLDNSTRRTSRGGGVGQFIEALAQGDPGELLGEVAQQGGKAGIAIAGVTLAAGAAALAIGAMTKATIELVRETDKLAKDTNLSATQIQSLQVIANLTGESVEDLAENYKKIGPEVARFEDLVRSSGAAIDEELRRKTRDAALAWESLKLTATGALNDIARELLPVVTGAINEMTSALNNADSAASNFGRGARDALIAFRASIEEAVYEVGLLISGLQKLDNWDFKGGFADIGAAIKGDMEGARSRAFEKTYGVQFDEGGISSGFGGAFYGDGRDFGSFPNTPSFAGGGRRGRSRGGGRQDITDAELQVRLLRAQQDEAQRALNGTAEAASRLYDITMKLYEAERAQAQGELPRARTAKLAEIEQKEKEALEKYAELIKKANDEGLKPQEELVKKIRQDHERALQLIQEQVQAEFELRQLRLERRAIEADLLDQSATDLARSGGSRLRVAERQARAAAIREDVAFERAALSIERERQQAEANEDFARVKELNALMEAEKARHVAALAEIGRGLDSVTNLGQAFRNLQQDMQATLPSLVQLVTDSFSRIADAVSNGIEAFVTGQGTLRQAVGSIVSAMLEPYKKWAQTKAAIHFAAAAGDFAFGNIPGGLKHTAAGVGFAALAGLIGAAGTFVGGGARAAAPSSGGASSSVAQNNGPRIINQDTKPNVVQIILRTEEGIIAQKVANDYNNNGTLRQLIRQDVGATA